MLLVWGYTNNGVRKHVCHKEKERDGRKFECDMVAVNEDVCVRACAVYFSFIISLGGGGGGEINSFNEQSRCAVVAALLRWYIYLFVFS